MSTDDRAARQTESAESLWMLTAAPAIWALHLLLSYVTAAVWCAKFSDPAGPLGTARTAIGWYTAIALTAIAIVGIEGFRRHRRGTETTTHDLDSSGDRHGFLGFATLLLSGLSALAVVYAALAASFFESCR
jgi:hypothetical protein